MRRLSTTQPLTCGTRSNAIMMPSPYGSCRTFPPCCPPTGMWCERGDRRWSKDAAWANWQCPEVPLKPTFGSSGALTEFSPAGPSTWRRTCLRRTTAFQDRKSAVVSKLPARTVPRFRLVLPSLGHPRSVVSLEEEQWLAAAVVSPLRTFLGALAARFGISAGGIRRGSGAYASGSSPSSVRFAVSNHWKMLTLKSSIAAHPAYCWRRPGETVQKVLTY